MRINSINLDSGTVESVLKNYRSIRGNKLNFCSAKFENFSFKSGMRLITFI